MEQKRKKAAKKKRVVPFLNYSVRDFSEYDIITSMPETQKIVFDNLIEAIKFSLEKNKDHADIFKISDEYCVSLEKDKWKDALQQAIAFYASEEYEDYEKCKQCCDIIEKCSYGK